MRLRRQKDGIDMFKKSKKVEAWDVVKLLNQLKKENAEQVIIIEIPGPGVRMKLKEFHNIYEGCCGEIVLDAE